MRPRSSNHWATEPWALTAATWLSEMRTFDVFSGCGVWERPGCSCQWENTAEMSCHHHRRHHRHATLQYDTWSKRSVSFVLCRTVTKTQAETLFTVRRTHFLTLFRAPAECGEMCFTWMSTVSTLCCCYLCWGQTHTHSLHTVGVSMTKVRDSAFPVWCDSNFTGNKKRPHTVSFCTSLHLNDKYETCKSPQNNKAQSSLTPF